MSIRDAFKALFQGPQKTEAPRIRRTWSEAPKSETTRLPEMFHKTPRLDPVELIASTIAGAPLLLYDKVQYRKDKSEAEPVPAHPFYDLMDYPSKMFPELDGYAVKYITAVFVELLGEAFWVKFRKGGPESEIDEILPIPPAWCIITPTLANPIFQFQPFGT